MLSAFGAPATARLLSGGQGRTWQAGNVILKPSGLAAEAIWVAGVLSQLPRSDRFRVAEPVPTVDGGWLAHGWEAWRPLRGATDTRRCDDAIRAGQAFHEALASLPRPGFLDDRDGPWTYGDRVAWGELPLTGDEVMADVLMPLARARRPVDLPSQVVHGDILGNVLFAPDLPPAIIDWPVYFRPPAWALAVAVVDAITWYAGSAALLDRWSHLPEWRQMLVRALIYRIATSEGRRRAGMPVTESSEDYRAVVELLDCPL